MGLQALGYLSVAMFFFLSGYGLEVQIRIKGKKYLSNFVGGRLLPYYSVYLMTVIVYFLYRLIILKQSFGLIAWIKTLTFGETFVANGWYFQTLLVIYILFFIAAKLFFSRRTSMMAILLLLFAITCHNIGLSTTWYESVFAFVVGMIFCNYKDKVDEYFSKRNRWIICTIVCMVLLGITLLLGNLLILPVGRVPIKMLSAVIFVFFGILMIMKIKISNHVTRLLGNYYLEIYAMQGVALILLHSEYINIENGVWYTLMVIIITIVLSVVVHPLYAAVRKKCRIIVK